MLQRRVVRQFSAPQWLYGRRRIPTRYPAPMVQTPDVPPTREMLDAHGIDSQNWEFAWRRLVDVSRTFSKPIELLPGELRVPVACGYLLCRVADTIEDHPTLAFERKRDLYQRFLAVVESGEPADVFTDAFADVPGEGPYHELGEGLGRVMSVYRKLPDPVVESTSRRVGEMSRGMLTYEKRRDWQSGVATVENLRDLERYCYFVAGTVGHLLTDLFMRRIEPVDAQRRRRLRRNAERFGLGLQMVNILKDQTDDLEEGWCFVPRLALANEGLEVADLFEPEHRQAAHRAVAPLFDRTGEHLHGALEYILAIPADHREIRVACLAPLWLAVRTLVHARSNDAMFEPGSPVKISRDEVAELAGDCMENADDDAYLRRRYRQLWSE